MADLSGNLVPDGRRDYSWGDAETQAIVMTAKVVESRISSTPASGDTTVTTSYVWCVRDCPDLWVCDALLQWMKNNCFVGDSGMSSKLGSALGYHEFGSQEVAAVPLFSCTRFFGWGS